MTGYDPYDPHFDRTYDPRRIVRRREDRPPLPLDRERDRIETGWLALVFIALAVLAVVGAILLT